MRNTDRYSIMINPPCPHCHHSHIVKIGATSAGTQRYRCKGCSKRFIVSAPLPRGTKPISDRAQTNAERQRRWFDNLSTEEKAAYLARKAEYRKELRRRKRNHGSTENNNNLGSKS